MKRKQILELQAKMRRKQLKKELLPVLITALEHGNYDFIAKNAIRIYDARIEPYEGEIVPSGLEQLIIDTIEVSWT